MSFVVRQQRVLVTLIGSYNAAHGAAPQKSGGGGACSYASRAAATFATKSAAFVALLKTRTQPRSSAPDGCFALGV
jgi:hypothetical protein